MPGFQSAGQIYLDTVDEAAINIPGYDKVAPAEVNHVIAATPENNIITFYYTKRTDLSYTVRYLEAVAEGEDEVELAQSQTVPNQTFKGTATEKAIPIEGYKVVGEDEQTITIEAENNEIIFYYSKLDDLSYVVNYLEQGTNEVLHAQKAVGQQVFNSKVTEDAKTISGYNLVGESSQELTITTDPQKNVITFYYTKRTDLSYTVHYYEQGTTKDLATAKTVNDQIYKAEVTEKAIDIAGYNKVTPASKTITIDVAGNEIIFE